MSQPTIAADRAPPTAVPRSPELALLLACARADLPESAHETVRGLISGTLDWQLILQLAAAHRLGPLLHHHLQQSFPGTCPAPALTQLRGAATSTLATNMHLAAELRRLTALLGRHGIACLAFKGPVLAYSVFGQLGLRPCLDLDVMIQPGDFEQTLEILAAAEYRPHVALAPAWRKRYLTRYSELAFYRSAPHTWLDLHWSLLPAGYSFARPLESVWQRVRTVDLLGTSVTTLGAADQLLFLCLHAAKHNWKCLSWLVDVAETVRNQHDFNWPEFLASGTAHGAGRIIAITLQLCQRLLDLELPAQVEHFIARDAAALAVTQRVERALTHHAPQTAAAVQMPWNLALYDAMERQSDRSYLIYDLIVRPTSEEWTVFPLPIWLAPLHFLLRPLRLAYRAAVRATGRV
jgi:hypothetical protein